MKLRWFEQCHQLEQIEYGEEHGYGKTRLGESGNMLIKFDIWVKSCIKDMLTYTNFISNFPIQLHYVNCLIKRKSIDQGAWSGWRMVWFYWQFCWMDLMARHERQCDLCQIRWPLTCLDWQQARYVGTRNRCKVDTIQDYWLWTKMKQL